MIKVTVHCDKCGADISLEPYQCIDLGRSRRRELCMKCYDSIAEKLTDVEKEIFSMKEANNE